MNQRHVFNFLIILHSSSPLSSFPQKARSLPKKITMPRTSLFTTPLPPLLLFLATLQLLPYTTTLLLGPSMLPTIPITGSLAIIDKTKCEYPRSSPIRPRFCVQSSSSQTPIISGSLFQRGERKIRPRSFATLNAANTPFCAFALAFAHRRVER